MRQRQRLHLPAQAFGQRQCAGGIGLGQDRGELLAAVARQQIGRPQQALPQCLGHAAQAVVAGRVAVAVVVALEAVQVHI